jgi:hypothetical protein
VGAVVLPAQSDPSDPFVNEPGILLRADIIAMIYPAREGVVVESASSTFQPGEQTAAGRLEEFELNGTAGFLLNYDSSRANGPRLLGHWIISDCPMLFISRPLLAQ